MQNLRGKEVLQMCEHFLALCWPSEVSRLWEGKEVCFYDTSAPSGIWHDKQKEFLQESQDIKEVWSERKKDHKGCYWYIKTRNILTLHGKEFRENYIYFSLDSTFLETIDWDIVEDIRATY